MPAAISGRVHAAFAPVAALALMALGMDPLAAVITALAWVSERSRQSSRCSPVRASRSKFIP